MDGFACFKLTWQSMSREGTLIFICKHQLFIAFGAVMTNIAQLVLPKLHIFRGLGIMSK